MPVSSAGGGGGASAGAVAEGGAGGAAGRHDPESGPAENGAARCGRRCSRDSRPCRRRRGCRGFLGFGQGLGKRNRELVLRLELHDIREFGSRRVGITVNQVVVGEQKPRRRRIGIASDRRFQPAELVGVGVNVGIETDQRRPVPAGTGREHGVGDRGRFVKAFQGEQAQSSKLMDDRSIRGVLDDLVGQIESPLVVAALNESRAAENTCSLLSAALGSGGAAVTLIGCE